METDRSPRKQGDRSALAVDGSSPDASLWACCGLQLFGSRIRTNGGGSDGDVAPGKPNIVSGKSNVVFADHGDDGVNGDPGRDRRAQR
jgi:hypothetical protein